MKKIITLALIASALFFTACDKKATNEAADTAKDAAAKTVDAAKDAANKAADAAKDAAK